MNRRKLIYASIYVFVCLAYPGIILKGLELFFGSIGAFLAGLLSNFNFPFNPFK